jgi:signal transduction histidine kinase
VSDVRKLSRHLREKIVDELGEEFSAKGLKSDSEPNTYSLEIETLTDACGLAWDDVEDRSIDR